MSNRQQSIARLYEMLTTDGKLIKTEGQRELLLIWGEQKTANQEYNKMCYNFRQWGLATKIDKDTHEWTGETRDFTKRKKKTTTTKKKTTTKKTTPVVVEEKQEESPVVVEESATVIVEESTEEIQVESTEEIQEVILPVVEEIAPLIRTETEDEIQEETPVVVEESTEEIQVESTVQTQEIETFSDTCVQVAEIGSRKASFTISREGERVEIKNDARTHRFTFPQESDIEQESDRVVLRKMKGSNRALATAVFFMSLKTKQSDPMGCFGDTTERPECEGCALRHLCK